MKTIIVVFALLAASIAAAQESGPSQKSEVPDTKSSATLSRNQSVITNQDVIDMLKARISPEIVVAKVKASRCECDTSPAALEKLKSASVPDNIILVMVESNTQPPSGLDDIRQAKFVYLVNKATDFDVFDHLPEKLKEWGRWTIVTRPEDADLLLVFAENQIYVGSLTTASVSSSGTQASGMGTSAPLLSQPRFLVAVDRASGRQLLAVRCERREISGSGRTAGVLVNRMRKQVERGEKPQLLCHLPRASKIERNGS
jgi:hypothetical protein